MTKTTFKERSMKKQSLVTKEASNRQHQAQGRPNTLTTHPETSHNIKLTKREDVHDCLNNNCVYTRLLAKNMYVYVYFGKKPACIRNFWQKTYVYGEDSGKKQSKGQTNKGECQWMNIL